MKRFLSAALAAGVLAVGSLPAQAATVSFFGSLASDNEVRLFSFTLAADADVTLRTWSYAGGTNAAGNPIGAGGFDPLVSLFFGSGGTAVLIGANDDGAGVAVDPGTGLALDSRLERAALIAGTYTVALTQSDNFANGPTLDDGFLGYSNAPGFNGRNGSWALDILGVDTASSVPEPDTLALAALALTALGVHAAATRRSRLRR